MTEKANAIMLKLHRLFEPKRRDQALEEFNLSTLDAFGPVCGDQGMAVLKDINDLGQNKEQIVRESSPKITVY